MKILFYVSKLYSIPVIMPVLREACLRDIAIGLFVSNKVRNNLSRAISKSFTVVTELEDAIVFNPDFVLCPGNFVDFRLPGIKVELFHGIGVEKESHYKIRHFFDMYLTSGPCVTERFMEMQKKFGYFRVVESGWPKIDYILKYDTADLEKKHVIKPGKKVILYAPTHSSSMESAGELIPSLESVMLPDEQWLCKPHEFMKKELLQELKNTNIRLIDNRSDITPFLHLASVLISDTSSVVYEFMALDKPVITYKTAARKDKGIDIHSPLELRSAIDRSLNFPEEFSAQRRKHLREVNPRLDGTISKEIIDLLLSIDTTKTFSQKRKPLNLFRKLQILYHSRFRKGYLR